MNERIKELAGQAGFRDNPDIYDRNQCFDIPLFAELVTDDIESEAVELIKFIANDYCELSVDKIKWQRDDYVKRCRKLLESYQRDHTDERKI